MLYENSYELNQEVFFRHHLRGNYRFGGGGAALSWTRREGYEPAYASSYIFRKFRFEPWFDTAAGRDLFRIGYRGMRGYRGDQEGFYGNVSYRIKPDVRLWLDLNRISYSYRYEALPVDDPDRRTTIASRLGADYKVGQNWYFSGSVERLQYPRVKHDYRALLKIS